MKKISFLMAALLVAMVGCQKEPQAQTTETVDGKVYMSFSVSLPETKSTTDNTGDSNSNANKDTEIGQDFENRVNTITVLLKNGQSYVKSENVSAIGSSNSYKATFSDEEIGTETKYEVYVIVNGTANTIDDIYTLTSKPEENIAQAGAFTMTNAKEADEVTTPKNWEGYSISNPYPLGNINVERLAARFDFAAVNGNVYQLGETEGDIVVTLTHAAVINMSKECYYFRRTSDNGTATGSNYKVGGVETISNYVVDTDYALKANAKDNYQNDEAAYTDKFMYHMSGNITDWTSLATLTGKADNWTDNMETGLDYQRWTYVSENTIPAGTDNQINGISTGVVFKATLTGSNDLLNNVTDPVYILNNELVGSWTKIQEKVENGTATASLAAAYNAVKKVEAEKAALDPAQTLTAKDYADAGFKCITYNNETEKHEMLYYYWNRHNDNNQKTVMGTMEFAVVRNNVYKLAVTGINNFGHPTGPDPVDPDPVDPTNPDESAEYYFTVSVKVLPWTVRVNNIEF